MATHGDFKSVLAGGGLDFPSRAVVRNLGACTNDDQLGYFWLSTAEWVMAEIVDPALERRWELVIEPDGTGLYVEGTDDLRQRLGDELDRLAASPAEMTEFLARACARGYRGPGFFMMGSPPAGFGAEFGIAEHRPGLADDLRSAGLWPGVSESEWVEVRQSGAGILTKGSGYDWVVFDAEAMLHYAVDDEVFSRIQPLLSEHGFELDIDWNAGPQHPPEMREEHGLRVWLNGESVTYGMRTHFRPLALLDHLLHTAGSDLGVFLVFFLDYHEVGREMFWVGPRAAGMILAQDPRVPAADRTSPIQNVIGPPSSWDIR